MYKAWVLSDTLEAKWVVDAVEKAKVARNVDISHQMNMKRVI